MPPRHSSSRWCIRGSLRQEALRRADSVTEICVLILELRQLFLHVIEFVVDCLQVLIIELSSSFQAAEIRA